MTDHRLHLQSHSWMAEDTWNRGECEILPFGNRLRLYTWAYRTSHGGSWAGTFMGLI